MLPKSVFSKRNKLFLPSIVEKPIMIIAANKLMILAL
jgi:hypothetical protein